MNKVDILLEKELARMLLDDEDISRKILRKRLGLKSYSTLAKDNRLKLIEHYRLEQLKQRRETPEPKGTLTERIERQKEQIADLKKQLNDSHEQVCRIITNAHKYGYDVEKLLEPLAPMRES